MRFMMIVKGDADYEAGKPPSAELMAAVAKHAEDAARRGVLLDSGGLHPSARGARVNVAGGKLTVVDGPFAEAKELVGGYAVLRADSREEAIRMGREFMQIHADILGPSWSGQLEIRQMHEPSDFAHTECRTEVA